MLSVDPGATGTGVAVWKHRELISAVTLRSSTKNWDEKCEDIRRAFGAICIRNMPHVVYIEMPSYMRGVGGMMVAQSGDLVKLTLLTGMLVATSRQHSAITSLVPVANWKGQLPKDVCETRIRKILKGAVAEGISNHAIDAIGIGLWALGRF